MFKTLLSAFLLQLVLSNEAKLQRESLKDPNFRLLQQRLIQKEHQPNSGDDLEVKWREFFHMKDLNHDGILTFNERDKRIQTFIDIYGKAKKGTTNLIKKLRESFDSAYFTFGGNESAITIDGFLNGMENEYKQDSLKFRQHIRYCHSLYIYCIDVNGDSRITWQETKDYMDRAYETKKDAMKNEFIDDWNPLVSVKEDRVASSIDTNNDSMISWEEYKDFRSRCSETKTLNILKDDFLDLNPYLSVEEVVDAWTAFEPDDKKTYGIIQNAIDLDLLTQPKESSPP